MKTQEIDFVLPWVDGSDPEWRASYDMFSDREDKTLNYRGIRFRDWGLLPFWFRAVELYAPWVRKIHFITCGQVPTWLNLDHPKLHWVKHSDYLPTRYLPTFNSHSIELNLHRIEGLSDAFVYFNDDTFLSAPVFPSDFFRNGLPRDFGLRNYIGHYETGHIELNNVFLINKHLDFLSSFRKNLWKWYNYRYGLRSLQNLLFARYKDFTGAKNAHLPSPFLKETFAAVWNACGRTLEETSLHKFRSNQDVNQWLLKYWQLATGRFFPQNISFGRLVFVNDTECIKSILLQKRLKTICVNEEANCDFETLKPRIYGVFEHCFPNKSAFEKE